MTTNIQNIRKTNSRIANKSWFIVETDCEDIMSCRSLEDGEPCSHVGCLNHVLQPCEGCERIAGYQVRGDNDDTDDQ